MKWSEDLSLQLYDLVHGSNVEDGLGSMYVRTLDISTH